MFIKFWREGCPVPPIKLPLGTIFYIDRWILKSDFYACGSDEYEPLGILYARAYILYSL